MSGEETCERVSLEVLLHFLAWQDLLCHCVHWSQEKSQKCIILHLHALAYLNWEVSTNLSFSSGKKELSQSCTTQWMIDNYLHVCMHLSVLRINYMNADYIQSWYVASVLLSLPASMHTGQTSNCFGIDFVLAGRGWSQGRTCQLAVTHRWGMCVRWLPVVFCSVFGTLDSGCSLSAAALPIEYAESVSAGLC